MVVAVGIGVITGVGAAVATAVAVDAGLAVAVGTCVGIDVAVGIVVAVGAGVDVAVRVAVAVVDELATEADGVAVWSVWSATSPPPQAATPRVNNKAAVTNNSRKSTCINIHPRPVEYRIPSILRSQILYERRLLPRVPFLRNSFDCGDDPVVFNHLLMRTVRSPLIARFELSTSDNRVGDTSNCWASCRVESSSF